jgi:hypothetical protein
VTPCKLGGAGYNARASGWGTIFEIKPPTLTGGHLVCNVVLPIPGTERYRRRRSPPAVQGGARTETILYNFTSSDQSIGLRPPFLFDLQGNLYGESSGALNGSGRIFELSPPTTQTATWTYELLYSFPRGDGPAPSPLLRFSAWPATQGRHSWVESVKVAPGNPARSVDHRGYHNRRRHDRGFRASNLTRAVRRKVFAFYQHAGRRRCRIAGRPEAQ